MKTIRKKVVSLLSAACLIATSAAMFALPASAKELTNVIDESTTYYVRNNATGKYLSAIDPSINTPGALGMKDLSRDNTYLKFRFHHVSGELEPADGGA